MLPGRILIPVGAAILTLFGVLTGTTTSARATATAGPATCESLKELALPNTIVFTAESVPAGSFAPPAGAPVQPIPTAPADAAAPTPLRAPRRR